MGLVTQQLNLGPGAADVAQEKLNRAVAAASEPARIQVLNQAVHADRHFE